ncbi:MAG TPA: aspartate carbamoyltransferase catalytic subunit [Gammaproteobacteria bacterium]|nr:aspartate carbamoyltransferase catalytic subunit [Gammaproteobacteria bacterium]
MSALQLTADGRLRHLLDLATLDPSLIRTLIARAERYRAAPGEDPPRNTKLAGRIVANLFCEPSTRTRASFEIAARRLGADVLNLDLETSSLVKGETLADTLHTLQAMNVDIVVVRHAQAGVPAALAAEALPHVCVVSAGEAHVSHPTQGLLDAFTVLRHRPRPETSCALIVGDILHSRVARSAVPALRAIGIGEIRLAGPPELLPAGERLGDRVFHDFEHALQGADVIMMLRIQKERMAASALPDAADYFRRWGLTAERLALARPGAIVMHPGPVNRGVEIDSAVADGPQSVIREQVNNGVAVRMAVLATLMETVRG